VLTYLEQSLGIWPLLGIDLETLGKVILEHVTECLRVINSRSPIRRDQVKRLERVLVEVRRFPFDHFYGNISPRGAWQ
jgi:hypothetical protein